MAVNATFRADFSSFYEAVQKAEASLSTFDGDVNKVEASLGRMMDSFSGRQVTEQAALLTRAITEVGGASTLTAKEMSQVNATVTEAIEKYKALGQEAPADMIALADATKGAGTAWDQFVKGFDVKAAIANPLGTAKDGLTALAETMGPTATKAIALAGGVTAVAGAALSLAKNAASAGAALADMSSKTGMSVPQLSKLTNAAEVGGVSMESLQNAAFALEQRMGEGSKEFKAAIDTIGISADQLQAMGVDQRLLTIATALDSIPDTAKRAATGNDLLGRSWREVAGAAEDLARGMELTRDIQPWTDEQAKQAKEFEMQLASLKVHAEAFAISIGQPLIGPLSALVSGLWDGAKALNQWVDLSGGIVSMMEGWKEKFDWAGAAYDLLRGKVESPIKLDALEEAKRKLQELKDAALDAANTPDKLVEKWKKGVEDLQIHVPKGTEVLTLLDTTGKQLEESTNKAVAAMKPFNDAMVELNSVGGSYWQTLAGIDGETVEAIKYYLEAGVSQTALANAYGLTATQIHAVSEAVKDETETRKKLAEIEQNHATVSLENIGRKSTAELDYVKASIAGYDQLHKLQQENADYVMKQSMTENEFKITMIRRWETETIAAFKGTTDQLDAWTAAVRMRAQQQIDALTPVNDMVVLIGKSAAERAAEQQAAARTTGDVVVDEYRRQQEAFMSFQGVVVAGTNNMVAATYAVQTAMSQTSDTVMRDWAIRQAQMERGEIFLTGMSSGRLPLITRAAGGPVDVGRTYLVGERGPELFQPSASGNILPTASGGGLTMVNTFNVNGSIADLARPLFDELTRMMKQTRQWPAA